MTKSDHESAIDPRIPRSLNRIPPGIQVPGDALCVFVSGSLVAGWGHAASDVDIYIVTASPAEVVPQGTVELTLSAQPVPIVAEYGEDGLRYDVEYWTTAQVDELFEAIMPNGNEIPTLEVRRSYTDVDWFSRLSIGLALTGHGWLAAAKRRLKASMLPLILARREFNETDGSIEDALGLVATGDYESAVLAARDALGHAIDGYLFAQGSFSPNVKWRYRKLVMLPEAPITPERYWQLETMRELDPAAPGAWVQRIAETCQSIMLEVDFS